MQRALRRGLLAVLLAVLLALAGAAGPAFAGTGAYETLVPRPRAVSLRPGSAQLAAQWTIAIETGAREDSLAVRGLLQEGGARGWRWRLSGDHPWARQVHVRPGATGGREGYRLTIAPRGITVEATTAAGRFYALQTLRQLARASADGDVPCAMVEDAPQLAMRGISLDLSRGQLPRTDALERVLRELAYYKINTVLLYLEDGFETPRAALVARSDRLRLTDVRRLRAVARESHVELIPIVQSLSHHERLLSFPEYGGYAENPPRLSLAAWIGNTIGAFFGVEPETPPGSRTFCPVDPRAQQLARRMVEDVDRAFESSRVHLGADEAAEVGTGRSAAAVRSRGRSAVIGEYVSRLSRDVRSRGRVPMVYGDMIDPADGGAGWPRDAEVVVWEYDPDATFAKADSLRAAGFGAIVLSSGLWDWKAFYPDYGRAFVNVATASEVAKRRGYRGTIASSWGDDGAENLIENDWAGFAFAAGCAWGREDADPRAFLDRFVRVHCGPAAGPLAEVERLVGWQGHGGLALNGMAYHRKPVVKRRGAEWLRRVDSLRVDMRRATQILEERGEVTGPNALHVAALRHAVRRWAWLADREIALDDVALALAATVPAAREAAPPPGRAIEQALGSLAARHDRVVSEYTELWLQSARPGGLPRNLERLERQKNELQRLLRAHRAGQLAPWRPHAAATE